MQIAAPSPRFLRRKHRQSLAGPSGVSRYSTDVVNAYIAIRDRLSEEVEKIATPEKLNRLAIANDLVFACLKPARSPYDAQFLSETEAAKERTRCDSIRGRIAKLLAAVSKADWR